MRALKEFLKEITPVIFLIVAMGLILAGVIWFALYQEENKPCTDGVLPNSAWSGYSCQHRDHQIVDWKGHLMCVCPGSSIEEGGE